MKNTIKNYPITTLVSIAILFCLGFIFSNRMTELFKFGSELMIFMYDIGVSTIAAGIFYYFQVFQPEHKKRKLIKENFKKYWHQTKRNIIEVLIYSPYPVDLIDKLCNFQYFREYFSEPHDTELNQTKWDGVLNHLSEDSIDAIAIEFEGLIREIDFLLIKIEVDNSDIFRFLKRLQNALYHHKKIRLDYGEEKMLSRLLWDMLGSWSIIEGAREYDFVEQMIEKI